MYKVYTLLTLIIINSNLFSNASNIQKAEVLEGHSKIEKECNLIENKLSNGNPVKIRNRHSTEFKKEKGSFFTSFCHFFSVTIAKFALAGFLFGLVGTASIGLILLTILGPLCPHVFFPALLGITSLFGVSIYAVVKV